MKKTAILLSLLLVTVPLAFAQPAPIAAATTPAVETVKLTGYIIDNNCAGTQKPEQLAEFVKTHTKECTLMPACVASGYSIYADGKLSKFDKDSSAKIAEFLKKPESKLNVVVEAKKAGEELSLVSINNQV